MRSYYLSSPLRGAGPVSLGHHGDAVGDAAEHLVEVGPEPPVHHVIDDRVHAGVGHRQPVEREVHVANIRLPGDRHLIF